MIDDSDPLFRQRFMKFGEESKIEEHIQSQRSIPLDRRNALQNANGGYPYNGRVPIATHESIRQDQGFDRERISTLMEHPVLIQTQSIARRMQAEFALLLVSPPGKEYTPEILAQILDPTFAESLKQSVVSIREVLEQQRFVEGVKQLRSLSDSMKQELGITDAIEAELDGLLDQIDSVQRFFKR